MRVCVCVLFPYYAYACLHYKCVAVYLNCDLAPTSTSSRVHMNLMRMSIDHCYLDPQSHVYPSDDGPSFCNTSIRIHGHQANVVQLPQELEDADHKLYTRAFSSDCHL